MQIPRYRLAAREYDVLSLERPLYRTGRLAAVGLAEVRPGDCVLDVGCGTGLNLPLLVPAVGPTGRVVGVDRSAAMLGVARRRVTRNGWSGVDLVDAEAREVGRSVRGPFDVILFCYSLSIVADWTAVWAAALGCLRPGGRVAVVDTDLLTGSRRVLNPLVRLLLAAGGVHPSRRVWDLVARDTTEVVARDLKSGHVHVAVGTKR